ncbi:spermidine/putrescine ABC transporter ATP-binding subunit [Pararhizobium capsulatum DSM 1112]|uniref:Spermidine/putrescine import ATP-binding protein PotA n=1 Tax=Pararhizobium capsulatum DSM 1112 TaxID=1121113 RepID=A0ABU0BWW1_9HYPH|nr:ABC transporter ATP-binding protein [Pararhizobium capsulatum]MDQ0322739.1 spermidine/putrescine ABC transporter ATP-binding subunit [Pararhizobium capsulatum DSM 1112]
MTSNPIVALSGVTKTYGIFTALHAIDLDIAEGEFVTLLGPSGCGKTTTLRLIGGFEQASTGRVAIDGKDVTHSPPYHRPVNTVFQDYALFPHMSVAENIGYGLSVKSNNVPKSERTERVADTLAMVGLDGMAHRRPGELSGGQRQRVAMARAIVRRPRVLLLDEPLSALDVKLREGMQVELKRLHRELGITFVMVTHDQTEALALSDRIVVINQGRIAQIGSPTDLYDNPASPYVADFIGATNLIDAEIIGQENGLATLRLGNGMIIRGTRGPSAKTGKATIGIRPERFQTNSIEGLNPLHCTVLESLFQGDRLRVELALDGITKPLFAELPRTASASLDVYPGKKATFYVDPADILVFEGDAR